MKSILSGLRAACTPFVRIALVLLFPGLTFTAPAASTITLAWDPSPDSDVVGYILYWGPGSGNYSSSTNVGNRTTTDFAQLTPGVTCYFVVTAVNAHGLESDPSNEISYLDPLPNTPPTITSISDVSVFVGTATANLPFTVGDLETPVSALRLEAASSDQTLVPVGNITFGGSGANRTVRVTPVSGRTGTATVTIAVFDADNAMAGISFSVNVTNAPPPTIGMVARWTFDEPSGNVVVDEVAANNGVCTNGVTRQQGVTGGALLFDGLDDVVTVPNSSSFAFGSGLSFSGWFKASQRLDSMSGRRDLIGKSLAFRVLLNSPTADGRLTFALNSGTPLVRSTTTVWEPNRWYHVVAIHDGATMRLYIDGALEGTATATVPPNTTMSALQIGGNSDQDYYFPGAMDDVRLYNVALSAGEVSDLHASYGSVNNTAPQISTIADLDLPAGTPLVTAPFVVSDNESLPDGISLSGRSSNPLLIPASNVVFGGSGSNRTVTVAAAAGQTGQAEITVVASDGELTSEQSFTVTVLGTPNVLTVDISGEGSVTPNLDGKSLVLGRAYLVTARPAAGNLFAGWSGAIDSSKAAIRIVMQANMKLTARFVPNRFLRVVGVFNGLFHEADEVRHDTSGHLRIALAPQGGYSARMRIGGRTHSWTGRFALDGLATNVVRRPVLGDLTVVLQLDSDTGTISGSVNHADWQAAITADRAALYTAANPSPYRARYTMLMPPIGGGSTSPAGTGFGRGLVNYRGLVFLGVVMADGQVISLSTPVSQSGQWPFFANLNLGRGSVLGWVNFADRPGDDFHGLLSWSRPSVPAAIFYPAGFTNDLQLLGSRYLPPAGVTDKILEISDGRVVLTGGNLTGDLVNDITLEPRARIINRSDNPLRVSLGLPGGGFVGGVRDPASGKLIPFRGAVLQKANYGAGFFRGTNEIGGVYLGP